MTSIWVSWCSHCTARHPNNNNNDDDDDDDEDSTNNNKETRLVFWGLFFKRMTFNFCCCLCNHCWHMSHVFFLFTFCSLTTCSDSFLRLPTSIISIWTLRQHENILHFQLGTSQCKFISIDSKWMRWTSTEWIIIMLVWKTCFQLESTRNLNSMQRITQLSILLNLRYKHE